jgi:hypothetical protein
MQDDQFQTERQIITTFEEVRDAAVKVASCAKRTLTILTPDLEPGIYDSEPFLEAVKHLVLAKRYAKVRVLISDPSRTVRNGNRLVGLARRLNTYIEFRNLHEDYRQIFTSAFIIADDKAVLYRADGHKLDGIMGSFEPGIAHQHLNEFEKPWEESAYEYEQPVSQT